MEKRKIIIDCDPGYDDSVAILLAGGSPAVEVLAVTTVAGNQTIEKVTNNARHVSSMAGLSVPVSMGATGPISGGQWETAGHVHGESGLDGVELPPIEVPLDVMTAVERIIDIVMTEPEGTVTLVPIGPLTNIARALEAEPRIVERVREVVLMGGAVHTGNVGPYSEFNVFTDPEAARLVFNAGWKVTMVGLDLTYQSEITPDVIADAVRLDNRAGKVLSQILMASNNSFHRNGHKGGSPVHDACAVAYVIDPTLIETVTVPVDVELKGELTRGMTVADFRRAGEEGCVTSVAMKLDQKRFWRTLIEAVRNLD